MLYNVKLKKEHTNLDCPACPHFDKKYKRCNGMGKVCFEYDKITQTIFDPITKLPLNLEAINGRE